MRAIKNFGHIVLRNGWPMVLGKDGILSLAPSFGKDYDITKATLFGSVQQCRNAIQKYKAYRGERGLQGWWIVRVV